MVLSKQNNKKRKKKEAAAAGPAEPQATAGFLRITNYAQTGVGPVSPGCSLSSFLGGCLAAPHPLT